MVLGSLLDRTHGPNALLTTSAYSQLTNNERKTAPCYRTMDSSESTEARLRSQSPSAESNGQADIKVPAWAIQIRDQTVNDHREQPWRQSFGTPKGTLSDEDWINYPAMFDMAKKGIKG